MSAIRVGNYVTHSMRPAWGVGKVFGQSQQHILVGFAGLPEQERFKRMEMRPGLLELGAVRLVDDRRIRDGSGRVELRIATADDESGRIAVGRVLLMIDRKRSADAVWRDD